MNAAEQKLFRMRDLASRLQRHLQRTRPGSAVRRLILAIRFYQDNVLRLNWRAAWRKSGEHKPI